MPIRLFQAHHHPRTIEISCPACGNVQEEPSKVVSSVCRACGEHFRVAKGAAVANVGRRFSGIAEVRPPLFRRQVLPRPDEQSAASETGAGDSWLASSEEPPSPFRPDRPSDSRPPLSAGAFFGFSKEGRAEEADRDEPAPLPLAEDAESGGEEALAEGSIAALIGEQQTFVAAEPEKMPPDYALPGSRRRADKDRRFAVRCYRCRHVQQVSRYAKSTQCVRCSAYIGFANYEIKSIRRARLLTRGDIVVGRRGGLLAPSEIACRHLVANGPFDARIDCSGTAVFRRSGIVHGPLDCDRLVVEKGCEVTFPDGAVAGRAHIRGRIVGDLTCSESVRIGRSGVVDGDLRTAEIDLKEGARVTGDILLQPEVGAAPPSGPENTSTTVNSR